MSMSKTPNRPQHGLYIGNESLLPKWWVLALSKEKVDKCCWTARPEIDAAVGCDQTSLTMYLDQRGILLFFYLYRQKRLLSRYGIPTKGQELRRGL